MKDTILRWWNRTWSNWSLYKIIDTYTNEVSRMPICKHQILVRKSNDGLIEYKKIKIS